MEPVLCDWSLESLGLKGIGIGIGMGTGRGTTIGYGTNRVGGGTSGAKEGMPKFIMGGSGMRPLGNMLTGGKGGRPGMGRPG